MATGTDHRWNVPRSVADAHGTRGRIVTGAWPRSARRQSGSRSGRGAARRAVRHRRRSGRRRPRLAAGDRGDGRGRASLRIAASSARSHCSMADSRSLRMHTLRQGRQLGGQRDRRGQRLARRHDPVDEPDPLGLDPVDATPGQDQVDRPAVADQAGQADRAEVDERHAEAPAVHAERRRPRRPRAGRTTAPAPARRRRPDPRWRR